MAEGEADPGALADRRDFSGACTSAGKDLKPSRDETGAKALSSN
jgi:hypothetical protein